MTDSIVGLETSERCILPDCENVRIDSLNLFCSGHTGLQSSLPWSEQKRYYEARIEYEKLHGNDPELVKGLENFVQAQEKNLMAKDYEIPKGMYEDVLRTCPVSAGQAFQVLMIAFNWLSENPISPSLEEAQYMYDGAKGSHDEALISLAEEWQRRMFLKKDRK